MTAEIFVSVHRKRPDGVPPEKPIIPDHCDDQLGPINGIYSALSELDCPLLVIPWDMPAISQPLLEILCDEFSQEPDIPICFRYENEIYPFPGIYPPNAEPTMKQALETQNCSMTHWLRSAGGRLLILEEYPEIKTPGNQLKNINTPEDLEKLAEPG